MRGQQKGREVVYVARGGDASAKWFLWGALLGVGVALLYAPGSGEQTRRSVQRRLRKLRAMAEEKLDEFSDAVGSGRQRVTDEIADAAFDAGDAVEEGLESARAAVERRLADARARRRAKAMEAALEEDEEEEEEEESPA